jgi:hypothetical protein
MIPPSFVLLGAQAGVGIGELNIQLLGAQNECLAVLGRNVVGNLNGVNF